MTPQQWAEKVAALAREERRRRWLEFKETVQGAFEPLTGVPWYRHSDQFVGHLEYLTRAQQKALGCKRTRRELLTKSAEFEAQCQAATEARLSSELIANVGVVQQLEQVTHMGWDPLEPPAIGGKR